MNLNEYAVTNGMKLTKPESNLLSKLETNYGILVNETNTVAVNPLSGMTVQCNPLVAALVKFVTTAYASYNFNGSMQYRNVPVAIGTYDRVRYLVLKLDKGVYAEVLD